MKQLIWKWSNIFSLFGLLWAGWIFGIIWKYYDSDIKLHEGLIMFGLFGIVIVLRETYFIMTKRN